MPALSVQRPRTPTPSFLGLGFRVWTPHKKWGVSAFRVPLGGYPKDAPNGKQ